MNIEYKIANQDYCRVYNSGKPSALCSKCKKVLENSKINRRCIKIEQNHFIVTHTIGSNYFVLPSKSGTAAMYCSEYCMKKHNHRFTK